jgi:putative transposase
MARGRRHTPEQILQLLQQIEADVANGSETPRACYQAGICEPTYYRWCKEFGNMSVDQAIRLKELKKENRKLKRLIA